MNYQDEISIQYFCDEACETFKIVEYKYRTDNHLSVVGRYKGKRHPVGLLMVDVVHIDLTSVFRIPSNTVIIGSKVKVLTKGEVSWSFEKRLKLPYRQPIYADPKTASFSWRKVGPKIGFLNADQDKNGACRIFLDFQRWG